MATKWNKKTDVFALMTGHGTTLDGSWDCGCVYGQYTEAGLMQRITAEAVKHLRASGVKVLSDSDKGNNKNMVATASMANAECCKYYMSVHCDYSGAPAGVYPLYVSAEGKKLAKSVGKAVAKSMGMKYRGVAKRTDLYELNATDMPACIFETGSIKADLSFLKDYRKYGEALARAICSYIGVAYVDAGANKEGTSGIKLPTRGYFKSGDSGANVRVLQTWLSKHGFSCGEPDGIYGSKTSSAVKKFQKKYNLEYNLDVDGMFGKQCLKVANSL